MRGGAAMLVLVLLLGNVPTLSNGERTSGADSGADGRDGWRAPIYIHDVYELQNMSKDLTGTYELANDVDASATIGWNNGSGFEPVGTSAKAFSGALDGRNRTITGLFINRSKGRYIGLFGYVGSAGTVKNIDLADCNVSGNEYVGGLIGYNYQGMVVNSRATGNRSYTNGNLSSIGSYVGGLVGYNSGTVNNSYATGDVAGRSPVGGLVGENAGVVNNSYATGNVSLSWNGIGGLIGENRGTVNNSHATGRVAGTNKNVGGLVGVNAGGTVDRSYATGRVTGDTSVGGLVGNNYYGTVSGSYANGDVNGGTYAGGLVGSNMNRTVNDSYATGSVYASSGGGGLVGFFFSGAASNCYSTGNVTGYADYGGLVGNFIEAEVSNCFWDIETSGRGASAAGTGKTTAQMKYRGTFTEAGWDLSSVWCIKENATYPFFRWQDMGFPTAYAGPDRTIDEDTPVTFDGRGSSDIPRIVNYTWTFTDGGPVALFGVRPTYRFDNPGTFAVTLKVTDALNRSDTDALTLTVKDVTAPFAEAGPDQDIDEDARLTFDGRGSDNVGVVNYTWTFTDGEPVTLYDARPTYEFENPGTFLVTLNVTDAAGNWATDAMNVTVKDVTAPLAEAGPDRAIDEKKWVTFDAGACTDNVAVVNYTWAFVDGGPVELSGIAPSYRFSTPGIYLVTLNVSDAAGNRGTDTLTVTVNDTTAPVADAGPDRTVDEGALVTLDGSKSSDNAGIVNHTWTFKYGAEEIVLYGVIQSFTFNLPGVYSINLSVSDAAGHRDEKALILTVRDLTPPVAVAGQDRTVPAGSTVVFNGSLSADNVGIMKRTWSFSYDGTAQNLQGETASFTFTRGGVYEVVLTAVDMAGNSDNDTVVITVVDTGTVTGIALDRDGEPVDGATVSINASDGKTYTTKTAANGSFELDIRYGTFTWMVQKDGYRTISGSSSVKAMGSVQLDLSGTPLIEEPVIKENGEGASDRSLIPVLAGLAIAAIAITVVYAVLGKRRARKDGPAG